MKSLTLFSNSESSRIVVKFSKSESSRIAVK